MAPYAYPQGYSPAFQQSAPSTHLTYQQPPFDQQAVYQLEVMSTHFSKMFCHMMDTHAHVYDSLVSSVSNQHKSHSSHTLNSYSKSSEDANGSDTSTSEEEDEEEEEENEEVSNKMGEPSGTTFGRNFSKPEEVDEEDNNFFKMKPSPLQPEKSRKPKEKEVIRMKEQLRLLEKELNGLRKERQSKPPK